MGPRVLIDTNIIIDLFRNVPQAEPELFKYTDRAISIVTWIETLAGLRDEEQRFIPFFENTFHVVQLSDTIAEEAVHQRKTTRLKLADAIILATAHVERRVLVTRNTRDFTAGYSVRIPYAV